MRSQIYIGEDARKGIENKVEGLSFFVVLPPAIVAGVALFLTLSIFLGYFLGAEGIVEEFQSMYKVLKLLSLSIAIFLPLTIIGQLYTRSYRRKLIVKEEKRVGNENLRSWEKRASAHDRLISRWGNIAMDPEMLIEFSLLSDLSDPRMINLYKAFEEADRLRPCMKDKETVEPVMGTPYNRAVRDLNDAMTIVEKTMVNKL